MLQVEYMWCSLRRWTCSSCFKKLDPVPPPPASVPNPASCFFGRLSASIFKSAWLIASAAFWEVPSALSTSRITFSTLFLFSFSFHQQRILTKYDCFFLLPLSHAR